ncbi:MAG: MFS transporter [Nocardioides sp.]|nr:MFS transporter [Nocardioides sp.]
MSAPTPGAAPRTGIGQLRHLLRGRWFRRLFAVRFTSQFSDGVFQIALASYVVFAPERAPSAWGIAGALAVVLLPFSVLGPFAGVLLDRWSRRQVLVGANLLRIPMLLLLAVAFGAGVSGPLLFGLVLASLSVNRFLLAGLSASLPHVVDPDELVLANAITPTAGTGAFLIGAALGTLVRGVGDNLVPAASDAGDVAAVLVAAVGYAAAAALATRFPRDHLGPDFDPARPAARAAVRHVISGLVDGLRHLGERRDAAYALAVIGAHRFFYGITTVGLILLYRGTFHPGDSDAAFTGLATAILVAGAGFVSAAVVTPLVTPRLGRHRWILVLLLVAAVVQIFPSILYTEPAILVAAYLLGVVSQGVKICVDTLVQAGVDDAFRGRVFSLYDVLFNVAFTAAAAVAALVLPADGKSVPVLMACALGYLLTAVIWARSALRFSAPLRP